MKALLNWKNLSSWLPPTPVYVQTTHDHDQKEALRSLVYFDSLQTNFYAPYATWPIGLSSSIPGATKKQVSLEISYELASDEVLTKVCPWVSSCLGS